MSKEKKVPALSMEELYGLLKLFLCGFLVNLSALHSMIGELIVDLRCKCSFVESP
jgi:hypothetical protein